MRKYIKHLGILGMLCVLVIATASHAEWIENGIGVAEYDGYQGDPDILADGSGGVFVVWQDGRSGDDDVYAQRVDALGNELWTPGGVNITGVRVGEQRVYFFGRRRQQGAGDEGKTGPSGHDNGQLCTGSGRAVHLRAGSRDPQAHSHR